MQKDIRHSVGILSTHCLHFASRWASELLIAINKQIESQQQQQPNENSNRSNFLNNDKSTKHRSTGDPDDPAVSFPAYKGSLSALSDQCLLAKTHFDLKDYGRVIHCLESVDFKVDHFAFFLSSYASYLEGEQRKEEAILESNNQMEKSQVINLNLKDIVDAVEQREAAVPNRRCLDAFHFYIKGVCLRELNRDDEAVEALVESVNRFPLNWSAWRSLSELVVNEKIFNAVQQKLAKHWMADIFVAEVMVETTEFYNAFEIVKYIDILRQKLTEVESLCNIHCHIPSVFHSKHHLNFGWNLNHFPDHILSAFNDRIHSSTGSIVSVLRCISSLFLRTSICYLSAP